MAKDALSKDIGWTQRFYNYKRAFKTLEYAVLLHKQRSLSPLEQQGLIHTFEFTHELAWKTLKDFLTSQGAITLYGSKDTTREAFALNLIDDGAIWMEMIESRNETSHSYNEETSAAIYQAIVEKYFDCFLQFSEHMQNLLPNEA